MMGTQTIRLIEDSVRSAAAAIAYAREQAATDEGQGTVDRLIRAELDMTDSALQATKVTLRIANEERNGQ